MSHCHCCWLVVSDRSAFTRPESWVAIPASHTGIDIACASLAVHPSSVRMVGMKADMLAAVRSQQKNMSVLHRLTLATDQEEESILEELTETQSYSQK